MRTLLNVTGILLVVLAVGGGASAMCWPECCGDELCEPWENTTSCPSDCYCGNSTCDSGETCCSCPQDCGDCCGNDTCDCGETCFTCADDCGSPEPDYYDAFCAVGGYDYCVDPSDNQDECINCDPPYGCNNIDPEHCHCGTGVICDSGDGAPIPQAGHDQCQHLECPGE